MKIRAITFGASLHERQPLAGTVATVGLAAAAAGAAYAEAGYEVQTFRLATPPLPQLLATPGADPDPVRIAQELEIRLPRRGHRLLCPWHDPGGRTRAAPWA